MEQSFSTRNLKQIWDLETRKGNERLLDLFPDVKQAYLDRRDARRELRKWQTNRQAADPLGGDELARKVKSASRRADDMRDAALAATSERLIADVESGKFVWGLHEAFTVRGRRIFATARNQEVYFAEKVLQRAVVNISPGRSASRQSLISGVTRTLDSNLPKLVVRTDFEGFYESIDHSLLKTRIGFKLLSPTFRRLIDAFLKETAHLVDAKCGLPTGIGLSAKLAEYFLTEFDREMISNPRTLFYGRYVDDIVTVLGETRHNELYGSAELARIESLAKQQGLSLSARKTSVIRTCTDGNLPPFELLGYKLQSGPRVTVSLTDARREVLKSRIDSAVKAWGKADPSNHGNRRLFMDRLRYITGNFRLKNNKRNAFIGIYFSNPHLNDQRLIEDLDYHLFAALNTSALPLDFAKQVRQISFKDGFENRRLHRFSSQQLKRVRRAWNA